jgi:hypothetical protein
VARDDFDSVKAMSARTLTYGTTTAVLFREIFYTLAQAGEEPLAAPNVPTFEKLRDGLKVVLLQEVSILETLAKAQAAVDRIDYRLDRFVLRVTRAVDDNTDGNTRKQIRKKLLKGKSISKFRRPVLGRQLAEMGDWSDTLTECGVPALVAFAPEAAALYTLGKDAAKLRDKAISDNRNFRDVGERKQFIDTLNAERKAMEGALAKLPFQDPTLPQDFADGFFYSEAPSDDEESIDDVKETIAALKTQLGEEEAKLTKMEKDAADAAAEAQQEKDAEAQAEALKKQAEDLLKQAAALLAKK